MLRGENNLDNLPNFDNLPVEILLNVFSYLSPENLHKIRDVSKQFNVLSQYEGLWKNKFDEHFPHRRVDNQIPSIKVDNKKCINWYEQFRQAYMAEYKALDTSSRVLFSLVKENHIDGLKQQKTKVLNTDLIVNLQDINNESLLFWASKTNSQKILDYFYSSIILDYYKINDNEINTQITMNQKSIFYFAIVCNRTPEYLNLLIEQGSKLDEKYLNIYPIHLAVKEGRLEIVKFLIKKKPNLLEQLDKDGKTPLVWAVEKGHSKIFNYLLSIGAKVDVEKTWQGDNTIFHYAARNGHLDILESLIKKKGSPTSKPMQLHPIHVAAQEGHLDIVKYLLGKNLDLLEQTDSNGMTPLFWAVASDRPEIVNYLLSQGANVNVAGEYQGCSIFHWAAKYGYLDIIKALVEKKITPISTGQFHPIHLAVLKGHLDIVEYLIENNLELLEQVDTKSQTPLLLAVAFGRQEIVNFLLSKGANVNVTSIDPNDPNGKYQGYSIFHWAAKNGRRSIFKALIETKVTPVSSGPMQSHPIHVAVQEGHLGIVIDLLQLDPKLLEQTDKRGQTPLFLAVEKGNWEIVEFLLSQNANVNAITNWKYKGLSILDCALQNYQKDIFKSLLKHNPKDMGDSLKNAVRKLAYEAIKLLCDSHEFKKEELQLALKESIPLMTCSIGSNDNFNYLLDKVMSFWEPKITEENKREEIKNELKMFLPELIKYTKVRTSEPEYKTTYFGVNFGDPGSEKVENAELLFNAVIDPSNTKLESYGGFNRGRLKGPYNMYLDRICPLYVKAGLVKAKVTDESVPVPLQKINPMHK